MQWQGRRLICFCRLTLLYGYLAAVFGLADAKSARSITDLCTKLFLPCLLLVKVGPELSLGNLQHLWALVLWCIVSISIAGALGWLGHRIFSTPYWTIMAGALD